ncbi:TIGR04222 domain-containing membrane protein [Streptomyces sp. NPDC018007]|uniref:TIGR04222 domain-containing membrane protein n=1 Tax=Streptomyces sp. NPDC018007 TaxID=3365029 RepID=UPI00379A02FC
MNALALLLNLAVLVSAVLLVATAAVSRSRLPSAGPSPAVHDLYEAAFLNGGPGRVVDTALTALHTDGRVLIGGPGVVSVQRPQANDPVERAVLHEVAVAPSGALHLLREAVMRHPAVQEIGDGLAQRGLLVPPAAIRTVRRWGLVQGVGCLIAFPVSIVLTIAQYMASLYPYEELPVPFVLKMLPAIVLGGISGRVVASAAKRITGAGRRAAQGFGAAHAPMATPAQLVATRGLRALPDPALYARLVTAARMGAQRRRSPAYASGSTAAGATAVAATTVWCAASNPGGSSCGGSTGGGSGCSSGSGCGGGSGSSCGGSGGSSCGGGGGSSCGGGGSSCGGGGGSSCGGGS